MENSGETEDGSEDRLKFSRAAGTPEKYGPNALAEADGPVSEFLMSSVCAMVLRNGDELPASIAFRGDLYLLFERGDIVRCHCRAWKDRDSGEVIHANGERWLTKTQRPKRIAVRSDGSRRAVAVAGLAAQGRWLCFRVV